MDVIITVGGGASADELRSLHGELGLELAGEARSTLVQKPPPPGVLGPVTDAIMVALGPGGAVMALSTVVLSWLRRRVGDVTVKVTRPDGTSFEASATNVRSLDKTAFRGLVSELGATIADPAATTEPETPGDIA